MKGKILMVLALGLVLAGCGAKKNEVIEVKNNGGSEFSLRELLGLGKEQRCSWKTDENGQKMEGSLLVKGKKFRQTVKTSNAQTGEMSFESVGDGDWVYIWDPKTKQGGMKIKMEEGANPTAGANQNQSVEMDKKFKFECSGASVSEAEVSPPSDVQFIDLQEQMGQWLKK